MSTLTADAIDTLVGKWYHCKLPPNVSEPRITSYNHYIQIRGVVTVFSEETKDFVQVEFMEKEPDSRYWSSPIKINVPFEELVWYNRVEEEDLPWKKGERLWSDTAWAKMSDRDLAGILLNRELLR